MKICIIFARKLFAVHYAEDKTNVYRKIIDQWTDTEYLYNFLIQQNQDVDPDDIPEIILEIIEDVNEIDRLLIQLAESKIKKIDDFFRPLSPSEYKTKRLSKQKARLRRSYTRIYGIRIDTNCYVIVGGALKFTQTMQEREHTQKELNNLNKVRDFLMSENIIDKDGFYEFYNEQEEYE